MKSALKSEIYKLLSIRSTYIVVILAALISAFLSFYIEGYKNSGAPLDANKYAVVPITAIQLISLFFTVIAILHITNEYRHNTITYTLTAINSRTKVMFAKILSISLLSVVFSIFITLIVLFGTYAGLQISNSAVPAQNFPVFTVLGKVIFYNLGLALFAMLVAVIVRSIAGTLVIVLIGVNMLEGLLGIVLKDNSVYLPFRALGFVVASPQMITDGAAIKPLRAVMVFSIYLLAGWIVAWYLFLKRDAN